ncbi:MAG: hypothetical protein KKC43_05350 [Alphaproteobacteria bacterium]|nr:hypothetical protein [Alphaproteobacteria bacterium]
MILRRVIAHVKNQEWTAIAIDFLIVVLGVFVATQVTNWNAERAAHARREQIVEALVADLQDAGDVQTRFMSTIDTGVAEWQAAFDAGKRPPPYYFRISGSDTGPKTWQTVQQMPLSDMFDPVTIFDLSFYYAELDGVGVKYVRYATFVENEILPNLKRDPTVFYVDDQSALKPEFAANADRLVDFRNDSARLGRWTQCLVYRLEADTTFTENCVRSDFALEGMTPSLEAEAP